MIVKTGDKVLVEAEVIKDVDNDGDCRISFGCSLHGTPRARYVSAKLCTVIDTDELKVGDLVTVVKPLTTETRRVYEVLTGYRLEGACDRCIYTRDQLTKLPPKPTYKFERSGDYLQLLQVAPGGSEGLLRSVALSDPGTVTRHICIWVDEFGCDGDEAREVIAEERLLGEIVVAPFSFTATRQDCRWVVRVTGPNGVSAAMDEQEASRLFPEVKGIYWSSHDPT